MEIKAEYLVDDKSGVRYLIEEDEIAGRKRVNFVLEIVLEDVPDKFTKEDVDRVVVDLKRHIKEYVSGYERVKVKVVK